jgi:hypothetical protein
MCKYVNNMGMNLKLVNRNIAIVFSGRVNDLIDTEALKVRVRSRVSQDDQPSLIELPDITALLLPESQLQIIFDDDKAVAIEQKIYSNAPDSNEKLIGALSSAKDAVQKRIKAYGFNFVFFAEPSESATEDMLKCIADKYFKDDFRFPAGEGVERVYAVPTVAFSVQGSKVEMSFGPKFDDDDNLTRVVINVNCHYAKSDFPDIESLDRSLSTQQQLAFEYLNGVLTNE